jgi:protocatechuate 3,4-dioxygenase alpha subunit
LPDQHSDPSRAEAPAAIRIAGTIYGSADVPVSGALIETWQPRPHGWFAFADGDRRRTRPGLRCLVRSGPFDDDGTYEIVMLKPGVSSGIHGIRQAPHLVVSIDAPGVLYRSITRIYFADEPEMNAVDPVLAGMSDDHRRAFLAQPEPGGYRHDIYLQGEQSTLLFAG